MRIGHCRLGVLLDDVGPPGLLLAGAAFTDHTDAELIAVGDRVSGSGAGATARSN